MIFVLLILLYITTTTRHREKGKKKKKLPQGINFHLTLITFSLLFKDKFCYITCLGRTRDRLTRKRKYNTIREENTEKVFLSPSHRTYINISSDILLLHLYARLNNCFRSEHKKIDFSTCFQGILISLLLFSASQFLSSLVLYVVEAINNLF